MTTDETRPEEFRNERGGDHSHIKGWGIDADPKNDPTYPMKNRTDEEIRGFEGMLDDLKHGIFPNTFAERGWQAEWKYNRKGFLMKSAATVAVTAGIAAALVMLSRRNRY